jgi:bifunctional DNA-binding transcriptional regulator/antitoxin component of YhaV-PrlF toxin-antitoxin module
MARKQGEQNIRKLSKVGGGVTYSITLPIEIIRKFKWKEKQKLVVEADIKKKVIIIKDWKK